MIVLEELNGDRRLPIWVGPPEATALALSLENVEMPRPMTYHFAAALLTGTHRHKVYRTGPHKVYRKVYCTREC